MNILINKIKQIRENQGFTQEEFAVLIGVSRSLIAKIENGNADPSKKLLDKLNNLFPTEFIAIKNTQNNTQKNTQNTLSVDLQNERDFILEIWKKLVSIKDHLLTVCGVLRNNTNHEFSIDEVKKLNKIEEAVDIILSVVFDKKDLDDKDKTIIISTLKFSEELLDVYITEMQYKLNGYITEFDDLLPPPSLDDLFIIKQKEDSINRLKEILKEKNITATESQIEDLYNDLKKDDKQE